MSEAMLTTVVAEDSARSVSGHVPDAHHIAQAARTRKCPVSQLETETGLFDDWGSAGF